MVTMAQRIEALRTERNLSRPALASALGLPRMAVEKFETGRQTPSQEQQEKMASYFGVSLFYLRGGYSPAQMTGIYKPMMAMMGKIVSKAPPKNETERAMQEAFAKGGDWVSEEQLAPVKAWLGV